MPPRPLTRLRNLALALPDAHEVEAWGEPTFRWRNKMFATYASPHNHHGGGRPAMWLKAAAGDQARLMRASPDRFFKPPYVGTQGWVGMWLDGDVDWELVAELLREAHQLLSAAKRQKPRKA